MTNDKFYQLRFKKALRDLQTKRIRDDRIIIFGKGLALRIRGDIQEVVLSDKITSQLIPLIRQRDKLNRGK